MLKNFSINKLSPEDKVSVVDIFNYYIENSFAAYPENKVGYEFYDMILNIIKGYPGVALKSDCGEVIGFGFLHPHNPMPAFRETAEISYFIRKDYTGKGLGILMLDYLIAEAKKINLKCILASISSLNQNSIKFHLKNGFYECGKFVNVGRKNNTDFDVVWMQRFI